MKVPIRVELARHSCRGRRVRSPKGSETVKKGTVMANKLRKRLMGEGIAEAMVRPSYTLRYTYLIQIFATKKE